MPRISIQSAKAKGRRLQQAVRDLLLSIRPQLEPDDVRSCPMGSQGADIILSPAGKRALPYSVECKAKANGFTPVYAALEQAERGDGLTPVAFMKQDRRPIVVAMYADDWLKLIT
ncbi:hypothetical protein [Novosphingobium chloroacetimidivorans]|uniref:hypothetical protein n=1 Tax=Novosphingobium chloroacetimidivorans TaxID=1428314 RepID=UPI001C8726A9|nr:hypothetical protein [Novosphingobium chloroacetimidivorans]